MAIVEVDFKTATYTAIVSDLHLCEAEPIRTKFPLWKKYKTKQFFFDKEFEQFLVGIEKLSGGSPVELVLNGDIFDFDSVTQVPSLPTYFVTEVEKTRGLEPEESKSVDKINYILKDHELWVNSLSQFIKSGNRVVFVIGNHDLELHWLSVQKAILDKLNLTMEERYQVRFTEWFYISNSDTLIEHGNQYDPYCLCEDPINPLILDYNRRKVRLPFGDWASRYLVNAMGFFNPHVETNYLLSLWDYLKIFFKYMVRAQPLLMWTWFSSSVMIYIKVFKLSLTPSISDPMTMEKRIEGIAQRANAEPRMVREMKALFVSPASTNLVQVAKELWLDRAFLILLGLTMLLAIFILVNQIFYVSLYWIFIPLMILLPPFIMYSRTVSSYVNEYKKPDETILLYASLITKTRRIVYGHTHHVLHEIIGGIEHLNCGTWSPAFLDIECTKVMGAKTFVWITPGEENRVAQVMHIESGVLKSYFSRKY